MDLALSVCIILSCLEGFSHNLLEVITIIRRVALKNQVPRSKVKVTHKGQVQICVRSITLSCLEGSSHNLAEVITIMRWCVVRKNQVPRSKVKVTFIGQRSHVRLNLRICVRCINFFLHQRLIWMLQVLHIHR